MAGLPDLVETRSISRYGLSQVTVVFRDGTNIYFARQLVNERLMQMMPQVLPPADSMGSPAPVPAPATGLTQPLPDAPPPPKLSSGGQ